jgi:cytosine/adenosine deaminase-related metal-dependent hydrolase/SAM-dependent methyltransferase
MASPTFTTVVSPREGYRAVARRYDTAPNPMLTLERRYLEPLLPCAAGLDVVDLGCGTGRWLQILQAGGPRNLLGVDNSLEMLREARRKLKDAATLLRTDGVAAPLARASADLVLGNFVLSYIEDGAGFAAKARTVLRKGGSLFLTDVHPETSGALQWRRGARGEDGFQEIHTFERSIDTVIALCESAGLQPCVRLEPCFGNIERNVFAASGMEKQFDQAIGYPAIYILQFRPKVRSRGQLVPRPTGDAISAIRNASIAIGPGERIPGTVKISKSQIDTLGAGTGHDSCSSRSDSSIDLEGFLLLPGFVNSHDHLEFALFPRLGNGSYTNSGDWAEDIHRKDAGVIAQHRQIPKDVRLWWGGIRNLLCGVTTVSHHNPYDAKVFDREFAVRVVRDYGWAHSLVLDAEAAVKKERTPPGQPFLIHLAEGIDAQSEQEIHDLHRSGALDKNTVVIHGLALNKKGRELLRVTGAGLIWCPSSNIFLFGRTLSARDIESLPNVALGSDSPLTAEGDLLDEVRVALGVSQLPVEKLYNFVTCKAARILRLWEGQGVIRAGGLADIVAVRDKGQSPAETLASLSYRDVELVMIGGRVHLASDEMLRRLPESTQEALQPLALENAVRWVRAPLARLFRDTAAHLPGGIFLGGKRVSSGIPD